MVLTGLEILAQVNAGSIYIDDFDMKRLNPNSYNLRLHNELKVYDMLQIGTECYRDPKYHGIATLDMKKKNPMRAIIIPDEGLTLVPGELYLGRTMERTKTVGYCPQIEGRSSIGRLGIDIHKTAGWGDDGFDNFWTLEITVVHPVRVYPFVEICQIIYMKTYGDASMKYKGKYQATGQIDTSKLYEEFSKPNR